MVDNLGTGYAPIKEQPKSPAACSKPSDMHLQALNGLLRYIKSSPRKGLFFSSTS